MTRSELEALTPNDLLELALDLDRRNRKAAQELEVGLGQGIINIPAALKALRGTGRHLNAVERAA
jgi:hypothetical protein